MFGKKRAAPKTDEEIVRELRNRDEQALTDIADLYGAYLNQVCYRIVRSAQTAKECVNDVYLKIWSSSPPDDPGLLSAFLSRLAREAAVDRLRLETRRKRNGGLRESLDDYRDVLVSDQDVPSEVEARLLTAALETFLSRLPAEDRVLFVKRYYYSCTLSEMASETGISRSAIHRTLARIKKELEHYLKGEGYLS